MVMLCNQAVTKLLLISFEGMNRTHIQLCNICHILFYIIFMYFIEKYNNDYDENIDSIGLEYLSELKWF